MKLMVTPQLLPCFQLLDELGKELEELRKYKIDVETGVRAPSGSISELPGRYQDLQGEIHKLKEVRLV